MPKVPWHERDQRGGEDERGEHEVDRLGGPGGGERQQP